MRQIEVMLVDRLAGHLRLALSFAFVMGLLFGAALI